MCVPILGDYGIVLYHDPHGVSSHSPGSAAKRQTLGSSCSTAHQPQRGCVRKRTQPRWGNAVKDFSRVTPTRQPARFRLPLPRDRCGFHLVRVAGERVGVRGPYRLFKPPHPGPLPPSQVLSESSADCGGEGAEAWETPGENPSRRCPLGGDVGRTDRNLGCPAMRSTLGYQTRPRWGQFTDE